MEAITLASRKMSRGDFLTGVSGSILAHVLILVLALFVPWGGAKKSIEPFCTVNLVSMRDFGAGAPASKKAGTSKGTDAPKAAGDVPKASASAAGKAASSAPVVPIKRLQLDEPTTRTDTEIKKLEAPEIPKPVERPQNTASLEKSLDKLITKPKAAPKPAPIAQVPSKDETPKKAASQEAASTKDAQTASVKESAGSKRGPAGAQETGAKGGADGSAAGSAKGSPDGGTKGAADGTAKGNQDGTAKGNAGGAPGGTPDGAQLALARKLYYTAIWNAIRQHWALPEFLKSQNLEAILVLVVRRDGKVLDVQFEKPSGQPLFDESVVRAVRKADPLPPFPEIYSPGKEEIGLRFRPQDLS